jgi:hypothetical protein
MRRVDKYNLLRQSGFSAKQAEERSRFRKKEFVNTILSTGKEDAIKRVRDMISVAPEVRGKESPIEVGYKANYVYIIKLKYEGGEEKYVNYSTNIPPEKISRAKIYNMMQKHVMFEYNKTLESMNIETMLENED